MTYSFLRFVLIGLLGLLTVSSLPTVPVTAAQGSVDDHVVELLTAQTLLPESGGDEVRATVLDVQEDNSSARLALEIGLPCGILSLGLVIGIFVGIKVHDGLGKKAADHAKETEDLKTRRLIPPAVNE